MARIEFDIPFPSRVHPLRARVMRDHADWMMRMGLVKNGSIPGGYDEQGVDVVAYMFPDMPYNGLLYAANMMGILVFADDYCGFGEEDAHCINGFAGKFLEQMQGVTDGHRDGQDPLLRAWADGWGQASKKMSTAWRERAQKNFGLFFSALIKEATLSQQGVVPKADTYFELRRESIGGLPYFDLIESGYGFEIPVKLIEHPIMRKMADACIDVLIVVNDAYSLERELEMKQANNLAIVHMHEDGCSKDEAVGELQRLCKERCQTFIMLEQEMKRSDAVLGLSAQMLQNLDTYIGGMRSMMRGNYDWSEATTRYKPKGFASTAEYLDIPREMVSPR